MIFLVLYNELPKYNDKRRGTISVATLRNLQRGRSSTHLFGGGLADIGVSVSLSAGTGHVYSDAVSQAGFGTATPALSAAPRPRSSLMANFLDR